MRITGYGLMVGFALMFLLAPVGVRGAAVEAWAGTIEIPTYELGPTDPNPAFPLAHQSPVYPYTMLDSLTNQLVPKTYHALYLENRYLKLTILPDLGGHLYSIYDKVDQREVLYRNHVVKYGLIGPRGAWISGGIEFSFPFAHTDVTVSPVESVLRHNPDGSATAVVGAVDWVSNMHWEVALTLRPDTARVEQRVTLFNSTPLPHLYLFWANAAVKATDDMQYIYPMRETISDDPFAVVQSWPVWQGVNESWYKNNPHAIAIFARDSHRNFFGIYYHKSDYGVVHVANFRQDPGKKLWSWGTASSGLIWAHILSDDDGPYNEIQSGRFFTQGYREFMPPRRVETWTEYWYPVRGLGGGFVQATSNMAMNAVYLNDDGGQPQIKLMVSPVEKVDSATVVVKLGSKVVREFHHVHFEPLHPVQFNVAVENLGEARQDLSVQIRPARGQELLSWAAAEPLDGNPDFVPAAGTHRQEIVVAPQTPVQRAYLHGLLLEKMGRSRAARRIYDQVLERDPGYVPVLLKQALSDYRAADFQKAESAAGRALGREPENPRAQYVAGVIDRAAGRLMLAQDAFWACIHYGGPLAPGFVELGEIALEQRDYAKASRLLERAVSYNPADAFALADLAVAERLAGEADEAFKTSTAALQEMPLLPYALAEHSLDAQALSPAPAARSSEAKIIGDDPQNYIAVAAWYHSLRAFSSSDAMLNAAAENLPRPKLSPMIYYYLASNAWQEGKPERGREDAQRAAALPGEEMFINRVQDAMVLERAIASNPSDAHARYALGNFLFAHGRFEDAAHVWSEALNEGLHDPVLLRNLGVYAWRVKRNLSNAAGFYVRAIRLSPNDYRLYADLDEIYAQAGETVARTKLFQAAPPEVLEHDTVRARYALFLMERSKFEQALHMLLNHQFKPWEGGVEIHQIFVLANIGRGKAQLNAHQPEAAEHAFSKAMEYPENLGVGKPYKPDDAESLYWLGMALEAQGKKAEARAAWKSGAEEGRNGSSAVYSALAFEKLGQDAKAQQILERCIRSSAQPDAGPYNYLVAGLAEHYRHEAKLARNDFRHALELDPSLWQARMALDAADQPQNAR